MWGMSHLSGANPCNSFSNGYNADYKQNLRSVELCSAPCIFQKLRIALTGFMISRIQTPLPSRLPGGNVLQILLVVIVSCPDYSVGRLETQRHLSGSTKRERWEASCALSDSPTAAGAAGDQ